MQNTPLGEFFLGVGVKGLDQVTQIVALQLHLWGFDPCVEN